MSLNNMFLQPLEQLGVDSLLEWLKERSTSWSDRALLTANPEDMPILSGLTLGLGLNRAPLPTAEDVSESALKFWRSLASSSPVPILAARSARNLWQVKDGESPYNHLKAAIEGFRSAAEDARQMPQDRASALAEALTLAMESGKKELVGELVADHHRLIEQFDASSEGLDPACFDKYQATLQLGPAGARDLHESLREETAILEERRFHDAWHELLESLATVADSKKYRRELDTGRVLELIWTFTERVQESEIMTRAAKRVLKALTGSDSTERKRYVNWWIDSEKQRAAAREPAAQWAILSELERLAQNEGLPEVADEIRLKIQAFDTSEFMQQTRTEFELPIEMAAAFEQRIGRICAPEKVSDALDAFVAHGIRVSPSAATAHFHSSFLDSFPSLRIGHEGATSALIPAATSADSETPAARLEQRNAQTFLRRVLLEVIGVVVPALDCLFDTFGVDALAAEIQSRGVESGLLDDIRAKRAAEAVTTTISGQFDLGAHGLVPRIEYAIRQAAKGRDVVVIRGTDGTTRGGHTSLNQVTDSLAGKVPDELRQHLHWILTSDMAANLRNDICHGDVPEVGQHHAAILVHSFLLVLTRLKNV